uniref:CUB domain-containing protein n=1 Tax=Electrophorus electricus TaxID=8005 RepID=A0A4W4GYZ6_ELEEL
MVQCWSCLVSDVDVIDYYDRPGGAYAEGPYANADTCAYAFTDKPGQRIPKAGAIAEAGVGRAGAEWSIFEAEAKGPNASAAAQANVLGVNAMARAEVGSASASAGPLKVTAGLGVDTGVRAGADGVEVKFLGTGIKVGETGVGVSVLGMDFSMNNSHYI